MEKQSWGVTEKKTRSEKIREEKEKEEEAGARKGREVAIHCVFSNDLWLHLANFQVKCTKHISFGSPLEVQMSKKWTLLWHEAHFQVKSVLNWRF